MGNLWEDKDDCAFKICGEAPGLEETVKELWTLSEEYNVWYVNKSSKEYDCYNVKGAGVCHPDDGNSPTARSSLIPVLKQVDLNKRCKGRLNIVVSRSEHEQSKMLSVICQLWLTFVSFGVNSVLGAEHLLLLPVLQRQNEELFLSTHEQSSYSLLVRNRNTFGKWKLWAKQNMCNPFRPPATYVTLWLKSLRQRGSSVPGMALSVLKWYEDYYGAVFFTSSVAVARQAQNDPMHELVQAKPLLLKCYMFLEYCIQSSNQFVVGLSMMWLLLVQGVMRFVHLQRSKLCELTSLGIQFWCALGKARKAGRRRPYFWASARFTPCMVDFGDILERFTARFKSVKGTWLLGDFGPPRKGLSEVHAFTHKKMSIGRFDYFSKQLWQHPPLELSPEELLDISTYSARREFPNIARPWGMDPQERRGRGLARC